jgi:hypothetical protein
MRKIHDRRRLQLAFSTSTRRHSELGSPRPPPAAFVYPVRPQLSTSTPPPAVRCGPGVAPYVALTG